MYVETDTFFACDEKKNFNLSDYNFDSGNLGTQNVCSLKAIVNDVDMAAYGLLLIAYRICRLVHTHKIDMEFD